MKFVMSPFLPCTVTFTIEDVRINIFVHYLLAIYNFLSSTQKRTRRLESPVSSTGSNTSRQNLRTIVVPGHGSIIESAQHEVPSRGKIRIIGEVRRPEVVLFDDPTSEDSQVLVFKVICDSSYQKEAFVSSGPLCHTVFFRVTCCLKRGFCQLFLLSVTALRRNIKYKTLFRKQWCQYCFLSRTKEPSKFISNLCSRDQILFLSCQALTTMRKNRLSFCRFFVKFNSIDQIVYMLMQCTHHKVYKKPKSFSFAKHYTFACGKLVCLFVCVFVCFFVCVYVFVILPNDFA